MTAADPASIKAGSTATLQRLTIDPGEGYFSL
jgi:hypothetical protein